MSLELLQKKNSTDIKGEILTETRKREIIPAEMITRAILLTKHPGEIIQLNLGEWFVHFEHEKMDIKEEAKLQLDEIADAIRELNVTVEVSVQKTNDPNVCTNEFQHRNADFIMKYLINKGLNPNNVIRKEPD
jgi:hypothetical protein